MKNYTDGELDTIYKDWIEGKLNTLPKLTHVVPKYPWNGNQDTVCCVWCGYDKGHDYACGTVMSYESFKTSPF